MAYEINYKILLFIIIYNNFIILFKQSKNYVDNLNDYLKYYRFLLPYSHIIKIYVYIFNLK